MTWVKVEIGPYTDKSYINIWRTDGYQINESNAPHNHELPFLLIDTNQPFQVPASGIVGAFRTLEEAQNHALAEGPVDWTDWDKDDPAET